MYDGPLADLPPVLTSLLSRQRLVDSSPPSFFRLPFLGLNVHENLRSQLSRVVPEKEAEKNNGEESSDNVEALVAVGGGPLPHWKTFPYIVRKGRTPQ